MPPFPPNLDCIRGDVRVAKSMVMCLIPPQFLVVISFGVALSSPVCAIPPPSVLVLSS